ncbi:APC family permease [Alicyclobacillus sp. SO9]|uniref:APC family permease n=1 Tax=Alicyclobacillus sp. SO9 TaxID=2665646 RepID=UPI0018E75718|nr:APC family permease [Alicyclobacillus sp. SO9]QQE77420.1 APC family permease [Alicyclobacillus sp. SO9]
MEENGGLKQKLNLLDLTFLGLGAIIGSGWLFGSLNGAIIAGPSAWIAWIIGAVAVLLIGLVYAELGGALPRAGGIIRYPEYSHGPMVGYLMGFAALIAYSSVAGIEAEAMRGYAQSWWPALGTASGSVTVTGWFVQLLLLAVFFFLNYWSVNVFGKVNSIVTAFKFVVPILVLVILLGHMHGVNFSSHGFAPHGFTGVESAVSTAGIVFAFLGFRQAVDFAGEAKNPQRNVPLAIIMAITIAAVLYVLLQIAFVGAIPGQDLASGWTKGLRVTFKAPYADLATALGVMWLATLTKIDAVISPSGTGNIYLASTSRVIYAWAKTGTFFKLFAKVNKKTGVPRASLWLTFILSVFWTLPFPTWNKLVGVISSATVMTYIIGPISASALRSTASDLKRPFKLGGIRIIAPLAFIVSSLIIYWTGWKVDSWLIGLQVVVWLVYLLLQTKMPKDKYSIRQQLSASWWLIAYYVLMFFVSLLGSKSFDGLNVLSTPWDQIAVVVIAIVCYYWGVASAVRVPHYQESPESDAKVALDTY